MNSDLHTGETKQPPQTHEDQHRRSTSSGQISAGLLHLKEKGLSLEDSNVHLLDREDGRLNQSIVFILRGNC